MTEYTKPIKMQNIWASNGDRSPAPDDTKVATGFVVEIPFLEDFNYLEHKQDSALAHINQRGICQWDSVSEYIASKSYVQGSNGIVYRAKITHTNVDPVTDTNKTNWEPAFYSQTDVYTKTESHATFTQRTNNLSDLTNTTTARSNLGGVVTSGEVSSAYLAKSDNLASVVDKPSAFNVIKQDATTGSSGVLTIATDTEVNAGAVSKAVTPLTLKVGFSIQLNPSLGHIKLPSWLSGFTLNWGNTYVDDNNFYGSVTFSAPFSVVCIGAIANGTAYTNDDYGRRLNMSCHSFGANGMYIFNQRTGGSGANAFWMAFGW